MKTYEVSMSADAKVRVVAMHIVAVPNDATQAEIEAAAMNQWDIAEWFEEEHEDMITDIDEDTIQADYFEEVAATQEATT